MTVELLTEHHLEYLSLKGGCSGSSEPTLVKMPHCWKSHVTAQIRLLLDICACICFDFNSFLASSDFSLRKQFAKSKPDLDPNYLTL